MIQENDHLPDQHWRRRNSELIFSAALLVRRVDHQDLEVVLELEHIARRLEVLGENVLSVDRDRKDHQNDR